MSTFTNNKNNAFSTVHIAVFASGAGSNAKKIISYFNNHNKNIKVDIVVCNKPGAGVLGVANEFGVDVLMIEKDIFFRGNAYVDELKARGITFIVLAGFLWKIPEAFVNAFRNRIINIHPALLPKFGGKGMYGAKVHEAVIASGEKESGITIHVVDEQYDNGDVIFQAKCEVSPEDTPDSLAEKIHKLEHENFPQVIEKYIMKTIK